ncbi:hypothetical protein L21SP2_1314 [Salinispira pacifica]|uniref:Uncharacterized protein n=1 Tax=Salinispira pacifica TaxID=1307761 RepID=V5WFZ1_9SPIO|nr:hypothetical protein L21SP2_1314 [Salinispira pacifica]
MIRILPIVYFGGEGPQLDSESCGVVILASPESFNIQILKDFRDGCRS